jgi:hypothetical protein
VWDIDLYHETFVLVFQVSIRNQISSFKCFRKSTEQRSLYQGNQDSRDIHNPRKFQEPKISKQSDEIQLASCKNLNL